MDSSPLRQCLYHLGMKTGLSALAEEAFELADIASVPCAGGPPRLHLAAFGSHRRSSTRPRHLQVLSGHGRAVAHILRPDRPSGAYTLHPAGAVDPDTTGVPMAEDIEIRIHNPDIDGVGEITVRHPNMFLGDYRIPELPPPT